MSIGSRLAALEIRATPDPMPFAVVLEAERQAYDLVIAAQSPTLPASALVQQLLDAGPHHVLLVRRPSQLPAKALALTTSSSANWQIPVKSNDNVTGENLRCTVI